MFRVRPVSAAHLAPLESLKIDPVLTRLYAARGVSPEDLDLGISRLLPPTFRNFQASVQRLLQAIGKQEPVCVVGDFDVDGGTATALCVEALRSFGAQVQYLLPNRFTQGYGLSPALVETLQQGDVVPHLLLTVDNGIAAHAGVEAARQAGMEVIVTDHHLPGETLPDTPWIVDPQQKDCPFPSKTPCGVAIAWYLMASIWRRLVEKGKLAAQPQLPLSWLDLVALGTVADMVPLDANNRRFVTAGIERIRKGRGRVGIRALMSVSGVSAEHLTATDFGFRLGPRLNAAGRLEDMRIGVELLLCQEEERALDLARQLDAINRERREIQKQGLDSAEEIAVSLELPETENLILVFDEQGHEGVVGLVAGALKEKYHKPSIVFAPTEDGQYWRGSARSVPGVHIRDFLALLDSRFPGMLDKFGGHAMAAGLRIGREQAQRFQEEAQRLAQDWDPELFQQVLWTDGEIPAGWASVENVALLEAAGPWGQGFPEPLFQGTYRLVSIERIGQDRQTRKMILRGAEEDSVVALQFRCGEPIESELQVDHWYTMAYQLSINRWRGQESVQRIVQKVMQAEAPIPQRVEESRVSPKDDGLGEFLELDEFEACL